MWQQEQKPLSMRAKPLTFIGSPQGAMGVRGPQGPRGPTGPRVSSLSPLTQFENDDLRVKFLLSSFATIYKLLNAP